MVSPVYTLQRMGKYVAAVAQDAALDRVLPICYIKPPLSEADFGFVGSILVELRCDLLHSLALYTPLI